MFSPGTIGYSIGENTMEEFFKQLFLNGDQIKHLIFTMHKDINMRD